MTVTLWSGRPLLPYIRDSDERRVVDLKKDGTLRDLLAHDVNVDRIGPDLDRLEQDVEQATIFLQSENGRFLTDFGF